MRRLAVVIVLLLALPLAACGGGDSNDSEQPAAPATAKATATPGAADAVAALADSISKNTHRKPQLGIPEGATPTSLMTKDIVKGKGPKAKAGEKVTVQYVGSAWSTGSEFDASWDKGQPFTFTLGAGQVIPGWDKGVVGMRAGGRRLLVIPPDLAYGAQGQPPAIGPNETLAFVVDLVSVK